MKKITTLKEASELEDGEQYIIDVFPDDPDKVTEAQLKKAQSISEAANEAVKDKAEKTNNGNKK